MKKKKTNQNVHKTYILYNFAKIGKELFKTLKYAGYGLFKIFDFLITNIMTILTYIGYAIFYVTQYVGKFTYKLGYLVYKYVLKEFYMRGFGEEVSFYAQFEQRLKEVKAVLLK